jgi:hypothetical protein
MSIAQRCEITKKKGKGERTSTKAVFGVEKDGQPSYISEDNIRINILHTKSTVRDAQLDTATAKTFFTPPYTLYIYRYYQIFRSRIIDVNNTPFFYSWAIVCNVSLELLNKNRYYIHRVISADFRFVRVVANDSNICG